MGGKPWVGAFSFKLTRFCYFDWLIRLLHLQTCPSFALILAKNFHPFFALPCLELHSMLSGRMNLATSLTFLATSSRLIFPCDPPLDGIVGLITQLLITICIPYVPSLNSTLAYPCTRKLIHFHFLRMWSDLTSTFTMHS
jgi:hypothetical protein